LLYFSGPKVLADLVLQGKNVLGVAGTHGKTTTTTMLAWVLDQAGLEPGFLIGGVPLGFSESARLGGGKYFCVEADEYDSAFFDKRSKFMHYHPKTAILNNLEFDHADIFADLAAIETQFHHLMRTIPRMGRVIANGAEESLQRVVKRGCWSEIEWFETKDGWHAEEGATPAEAVFSFEGKEIGRAEMPMAGPHNRANALAALPACRHVGVWPADPVPPASGCTPGTRKRTTATAQAR